MLSIFIRPIAIALYNYRRRGRRLGAHDYVVYRFYPFKKCTVNKVGNLSYGNLLRPQTPIEHGRYY